MFKKVAIIGTHGVGKTCLVHLTAGFLTSKGVCVETILEVARELSRLEPNLVKINEYTTLEAQTRILEYQFEREKHAESTSVDVCLCDRAFDNYLYMERKFGPQEKYLNLVLGHMKEHPYNLIVKIPVLDSTITPDGTRDTNTDFQKDIDQRINKFLREYKIPALILHEPYMPFREDWAYAVIKALGYTNGSHK